jgi:hypothetical protein
MAVALRLTVAVAADVDAAVDADVGRRLSLTTNAVAEKRDGNLSVRASGD